MKKNIAFLLLFSASLFSAEILKKEDIRFGYIEKIAFDDHTYIHIKNTYNSAGDFLLHDPSCKCIKFDYELFNKIQDKLKERK